MAIASGTNGTCTWSISDSGALTIRPTSGSSGYLLHSWLHMANTWPWRDYADSVTSVSLSGTIRIYESPMIGDPTEDGEAKYLFQNFKNCRTISGLGSLKGVTTAEDMFYGCSSLTSVDIRNMSTAAVTDMDYMFYHCSSLTSLDLSSFNTSAVTSMSYMFDGCSSLTSLNVSSFDTSSVKYIAGMFGGCSSLTSLDLSSFDTSSVDINMGYMFRNCSSLTSLDLSSFNTSSVEGMNSMFLNCSSLVSLDISSFRTSNVTDMSNMFSGCSSLTSLDLSSFDTSSVIWMNHMFRNCSSLISLDLSSFNTSAVDSGSDTYKPGMQFMFDGCSSLTSLDLSSFRTSNVTDMKNMFNNCSAMTSLNVSSFNTSSVLKMSAMFGNCSSLTSLDLSSFDTSAVTDMSFMFNDCSALTSVTFGSSFGIPDDEQAGNTDFIPPNSSCMNQTNGISVADDEAFRLLTTAQRTGVWRRFVTEKSFAATAVRGTGTTPDEDGNDIIVTSTWVTNAETQIRTIDIYKKLSTEPDYPANPTITKTVSGDSGTDVTVVASVGDDAIDLKVVFYDGVTEFLSFPSVASNIQLMTLDRDGNAKFLGNVTDGYGNSISDSTGILAAYPIGSIYMSVNATDPGTLFGGTWERITGRFLLAATDGGASGASQAAGNTGGEATHTLTVNEMPSHGHKTRYYSSNGSSGSGIEYGSLYKISAQTTGNSSMLEAEGGGAAHNNMPPYLAVYVWKRTA